MKQEKLAGVIEPRIYLSQAAISVPETGTTSDVVEVRYEKNHAYCRYKPQESWEEKNRRAIDWFDALPA